MKRARGVNLWPLPSDRKIKLLASRPAALPHDESNEAPPDKRQGHRLRNRFGIYRQGVGAGVGARIVIGEKRREQGLERDVELRGENRRERRGITCNPINCVSDHRERRRRGSGSLVNEVKCRADGRTSLTCGGRRETLGRTERPW